MHFFYTYADIQISTKYESGIECACAGACAGAGACPCACPCIDGCKSRTYAIARDNTDNRFIHTTPSHCAFNNTSLIYPPIHRSIQRQKSVQESSRERSKGHQAGQSTVIDRYSSSLTGIKSHWIRPFSQPFYTTLPMRSSQSLHVFPFSLFPFA